MNGGKTWTEVAAPFSGVVLDTAVAGNYLIALYEDRKTNMASLARYEL